MPPGARLSWRARRFEATLHPKGPNPRNLLGTEHLERTEIETLLERGRHYKSIRPNKKLSTLLGRSVVNLFFEPSTRTRTSFEIAAKRLGADTIGISALGTSLSKGESLVDTLNTLAAMNPDIIVMRHSASGAPHFLSSHLSTAMVNAGDGRHEHPTQALLDALTILEVKGSLLGLRVAIIGDIAHSRVARSNIHLLSKFGADIVACGPSTTVSGNLTSLAPGVTLTYDMSEAVRDADVVMMLRVQLERQNVEVFPKNEYFRHYGLTLEHVALAKPDAIVLHPGPINRGREISSEVADSQRSMILSQVENGVAIRMAVLEWVCGD